jgi:MFS-type transporter involved in bile tolerance (Atg22 family)
LIAIASRTFAFYYLLQTILALQLTHRIETRFARLLHRASFGVLAVVLAFVVVFARPAS